MAKKKKVEEVVITPENIVESNIDDVMSSCFGRYSKYVLQERAVPDVRDGLKPVQRRILYTMYLEGNTSNKPTRKCARTVGAVIGRFHPHGDTSVYEAMVRLSQDWKMRVPLIDFQGNNGSIDGDGAAAYRYTEARLAEISDQLVLDLNKNTVDMELNFDDQELEPTVLPSRFPNLLVNGASGIAMGASTDIPPHNLGEIIDAINYRIHHKNCKTSDLLNFVKGPDFPTGGIIINGSDLPHIYENGKGLIKLMCKSYVREGSGCNQIVISEIPYGVNKSALVAEIDKCRFANSLTSVLEVRDETDKDGLAIVIDVKKDADAENIRNFIISKGVLTESIKFNMLVIDHYRPKTIGLLKAIDCYIEHQVEVITRRSNYDLDKKRARLHIVEGLIKMVSILDKVIASIRSSEGKADAKVKLVEKFEFSEEQAEAILNIQLYRLSNTDITALIKEADGLRGEINYLEELLASPTKMNNLIAKDLNAIKDKFADPRRTEIQDTQQDIQVDKRALITKEETMVVFTRDGYFKRCQMRSYLSSNGIAPGIKDGDVIKGIVKCYTTDFILAFTTLGNYLFIPVYRLHDNKWKDEGKHINEIGSIAGNEKIISGIVVSEFKEGVNVVLVSRLGQIKRSPLKEFEVSRYSKPIKCFKLSGNDYIVSASYTSGNHDVLLVNTNGDASLFNENDIPLVSLRAGGVKAMTSTKDKAEIAGMVLYPQGEYSRLAILTNNHASRIVDIKNVIRTSRLGMKTQLFKTFKSDPQSVACISQINRGEKTFEMTALLKNSSTVKIEFPDTKPTSLDSYLKKNLQIGLPFPIIDCYRYDVPAVDKDTKVFTVVKKPVTVKVEKVEVEQLSLFDYFDDDDAFVGRKK